MPKWRCSWGAAEGRLRGDARGANGKAAGRGRRLTEIPTTRALSETGAASPSWTARSIGNGSLTREEVVAPPGPVRNGVPEDIGGGRVPLRHDEVIQDALREHGYERSSRPTTRSSSIHSSTSRVGIERYPVTFESASRSPVRSKSTTITAPRGSLSSIRSSPPYWSTSVSTR